MRNSAILRLAFPVLAEYNLPMRDYITVPEDADEDFDPGYEEVEDTEHGDEELGDIPDEEVEDG